ncbi:hypothetical protein M5D96_014238, partial [Drosophila gunungcola]
LIPRRSHTSRDLSRSQETFETVSSLAAVTPVGICQGARKHLRQSQPSS